MGWYDWCYSHFRGGSMKASWQKVVDEFTLGRAVHKTVKDLLRDIFDIPLGDLESGKLTNNSRAPIAKNAYLNDEYLKPFRRAYEESRKNDFATKMPVSGEAKKENRIKRPFAEVPVSEKENLILVLNYLLEKLKESGKNKTLHEFINEVSEATYQELTAGPVFVEFHTLGYKFAELANQTVYIGDESINFDFETGDSNFRAESKSDRQPTKKVTYFFDPKITRQELQLQLGKRARELRESADNLKQKYKMEKDHRPVNEKDQNLIELKDLINKFINEQYILALKLENKALNPAISSNFVAKLLEEVDAKLKSILIDFLSYEVVPILEDLESDLESNFFGLDEGLNVKENIQKAQSLAEISWLELEYTAISQVFEQIIPIYVKLSNIKESNIDDHDYMNRPNKNCNVM